MAQKLVEALKSGDKNIEKLLHNDLETAVINDYNELQEIKMKYPESIMSGSGSTFFVLNKKVDKINDRFWVKAGLKSIPYGICQK